MNKFHELTEKAKKLRRDVLTLTMEQGEGHLGGSFSEIEILISLYSLIMKKEDKFVLSKGHACYPLYILLREKGCNPKICGHPDLDIGNEIHCTTGSLGHGLPMGIGMALARKIVNRTGKIFVLMSDGECQEGTTWESSLIASHHKLDNLTVIIDHNKIQALDRIENVLSLGNLKNKFESFGLHVSEVDGHSFKELVTVLKKEIKGKPHVVIAHTVKGKGVSFIENDPKWHARLPSPIELKRAYDELR
jgi:transketolase